MHTRLRWLADDWEEPKGTALDLMILTLTNFVENEPDEDKVDLEDCKVMLEKLNAWKRLKDKGFEFLWWISTSSGDQANYYIPEYDNETIQDLNLLFGGEDGES